MIPASPESFPWISLHGPQFSLIVVTLSALAVYAMSVWAVAGIRPVPGALSHRSRYLLAVSALGALCVAGAIVYALDSPGAVYRFDHALAAGLAHTMTSFWYRGLVLYTHLGDRQWLMVAGAVVVAVLAWRRHWVLLVAWVAATAGGGIINRVLKATFERVRPDHMHGYVEATGFSFPSGHATGAMSIFAMGAFLLMHWAPAARRPLIAAVAAALVVSVGASRVLLQVHFATDVVAGWAITWAWVAVCVLFVDHWVRRHG